MSKPSVIALNFGSSDVDLEQPELLAKLRHFILGGADKYHDCWEGCIDLGGVEHFVTCMVKGEVIEAIVIPRDDAEAELNRVGLSTIEPWSPVWRGTGKA
jgi:hypothetical protein